MPARRLDAPIIMGIVYSQSTMLRQRLAKQSAAEKRKYNSSTVSLAGYTRDQIKKRVSESDQFTSGEAAILTYIADKDTDNFVLTVTAVRAALKFGEMRWSTARKELESRGFLTQQSVALDDRSRHWFLDVDFTPLRDAKYDAPPPREKTERLYNARTHVTPDFSGINPQKAQPAAPRKGGRRECAEGPRNKCSLGVEPAAQAQASRPPQSKPAAHDRPPAPKRGGAVLCAAGANNPLSKDKSMQINFSHMREFFDFFGRNGILSVKLGGQQRKKKDGKRGAPMGLGAAGGKGWNPVAMGSPVRSAAAAEMTKALLAHLEGKGKRNLELVCAAAEDSQGLTKSILLDDLDADGVKALKTKWRGPGVILATSPGNYQAVLILPEPMGREDRRSVTGQLVTMVGADPGAAGVGQLHRFPGSVNHKAGLAEPFVCRIVEYFTGGGEGVQPVKASVKPVPARVSQLRPATLRPMRKRQWREAAKTSSDLAFRHAVELLDSGASAADVESALSSPEWLRHHSAADWPARTRENAERFRAGEPFGSRRGALHA